jgi:hypothetical protein
MARSFSISNVLLHNNKMASEAPAVSKVGLQMSLDNATRPDTNVVDVESQKEVTINPPSASSKSSAFKSLGWLDRYLAVWILLAIILGILLGNFAPDTTAALDRGRFVGVSIPIGAFIIVLAFFAYTPILLFPF